MYVCINVYACVYVYVCVLLRNHWFQWHETNVLDNWQLAELPQSGGREFDPRRVHDNVSVPLWVYMRFLCQSIKFKPTNMYFASARAQFKINTCRCWNWHPCIPDGLSVVQCSLGHVIGIVFIDTISVAWSERAGQLAAGGVASVWSSWERSPPDPR